MSNAHITAARRCNRFKGNARLLLMILADAASNGEKVTKGGFYNLPLGWTSKGEKQLMKDMNIDRRQTITDLIAELEHAGAIIRKQQLPEERHDLRGYQLAEGELSDYRSHGKRGI